MGTGPGPGCHLIICPVIKQPCNNRLILKIKQNKKRPGDSDVGCLCSWSAAPRRQAYIMILSRNSLKKMRDSQTHTASLKSKNVARRGDAHLCFWFLFPTQVTPRYLRVWDGFEQRNKWLTLQLTAQQMLGERADHLKKACSFIPTWVLA